MTASNGRRVGTWSPLQCETCAHEIRRFEVIRLRPSAAAALDRRGGVALRVT